MTRGAATRPLPAHGTYARYRGRVRTGIPGCKCEQCVTAGRRYHARQYTLAATGRSLSVDAGRAAAHLRGLRREGVGQNELARMIGCAGDTVGALLQGRRKTIWRSTEAKILRLRAVQADTPDVMVSSVGTVRRVRALVAIGHSVTDVRRACGIRKETLADLLTGRPLMVKVSTRASVEEAFRRLSMSPGSSVRSLNRAKRERWAPPLAWEDIDDPLDRPNYGKRVLRRVAIVEDTAELTARGLSPEEIAGRLGISWEAVRAAHKRCGVPVPVRGVAA